jgi:hypothetical protein
LIFKGILFLSSEIQMVTGLSPRKSLFFGIMGENMKVSNVPTSVVSVSFPSYINFRLYISLSKKPVIVITSLPSLGRFPG